ncbi:MAG: peptidylprolyl isomerase [Gammaproteobacteria bacterium]
MNIAENKVVTLDYTLTDDAGSVIDSSQDGSFTYLHGSNNIIAGLEKALEGRTVGDEFEVAIQPDDAYGHRDQAKVAIVPRAAFPADIDLEVGMQFHAEGPQGQAMAVMIAGVDGDDITVDGNHPLAGERLTFHVKVLDVRSATLEEIHHGHVHGPGGHHHH